MQLGKATAGLSIIDIRYRPNDLFRSFGVHIHPLERRKGYAAEILRQGLDFKEKLAYAQTILSNGGLEKEFLHEDGNSISV